MNPLLARPARLARTWCRHLATMLRFLYRAPEATAAVAAAAGLLAFAMDQRYCDGADFWLRPAPLWGTAALLASFLLAYLLAGSVLLWPVPALRQRHAARRLGLAFLLGALCVTLPPWLLRARDGEWYVELPFIQFMFAAGVAVLLPQELAFLWQHGAWGHLSPPTRRRLLWLGVAGAGLVLAAQTALFLVADLPLQAFPATGMAALLLNIGILVSLVFLLFLVTNRFRFAVLAVLPLYLFLIVANVAKTIWMHSAVQVLDLVYLAEFRTVALAYLGFWGCAALLLLPVAWLGGLAWCWRRSQHRSPLGERLLMLAQLLLMGYALLQSLRLPLPPLLASSLQTGFDFADVEFNPARAALRSGPLLYFSHDFIERSWQTAPPANYSPATVRQSLAAVATPTRAPLKPAAAPISLITLCVESFCFSEDLGIQLNTEPTPTLRALARTHPSGHAIVPSIRSGTCNTEFELLSGMTKHFLPGGSCPYNQYIRSPIPSLMRQLKAQQYRTAAIFPDDPTTYSRGAVVPLMGGFDETVWLTRNPDLLDFARRCTADDAIIDAVIAQTRHGAPYFIHAFNGATHGPYDYYAKLPADAGLTVLNAPNEPARREQTTYFWALRNADAAIARLVRHLAASPTPTILLVMGDHQPPLASTPPTLITPLPGEPMPSFMSRQRRVPLLVWANFPLEQEKLTLSANFIATYLLEKMGIPPTGFLAINNALRADFQVLSGYLQPTGGPQLARDHVPPPLQPRLDAYRLLQYDLLLGQRHAAAQLGEPAAP